MHEWIGNANDVIFLLVYRTTMIRMQEGNRIAKSFLEIADMFVKCNNSTSARDADKRREALATISDWLKKRQRREQKSFFSFGKSKTSILTDLQKNLVMQQVRKKSLLGAWSAIFVISSGLSSFMPPQLFGSILLFFCFIFSGETHDHETEDGRGTLNNIVVIIKFFLYLFIHSYIYIFIRSFIHSFIHSFISFLFN